MQPERTSGKQLLLAAQAVKEKSRVVAAEAKWRSIEERPHGDGQADSSLKLRL
jgi:hypothetical protein